MVETFIHLLTFISILIPAYFIVVILRKERGDLTKSFLWLFIWLLTLAIFHLLEVFESSNINWLPLEGTLSHAVIEHLLTMVVFVAFSAFLYFFKRKYIDMIDEKISIVSKKSKGK